MAVPTPEEFFAEAEKRNISLTDEQKQKITERLTGASSSLTPAQQSQPSPNNMGNFTVPQAAIGLVEGAAHLASGSISAIAAGPAVLDSLVRSFKDGDGEYETISKMNEIAQRRSGAFTYQPQTQAGQAAVDSMGQLMAPVGRMLDMFGDAVTFGTGSPYAGAAAQTAVEAIPAALGVRPAMNPVRKFNDVRRVNKAAERMGIELRADSATQLSQIEQYARIISPNGPANLEELASKLVQAREISRRNRDALYDDFKASVQKTPNTGVRRGDMRLLADTVNGQFDILDWPLSDMPKLRRSIGELNSILDGPQNDIIKLNAITGFKKKLNRRIGKDSLDAENEGLRIMGNEIDSFLTDMFNRDMISGDPAALNKWRMASGAAKDHIQRFNTDSTIRDMTLREATPDQLKQWILGASSVGAKPKAVEMIRRVRDIVGDEGMQSLKGAARYDVLKPLFEETPNYSRFVRNYDNFVQNKQNVVKELFGDGELKDIKDLRNMAVAIGRNSSAQLALDFDALLARTTVGAEIARKGALVQLTSNLLRAVRGTVSDSRRKQIISDFAGYDISTPMFPASVAYRLGVAETAFSLPEEER